VIALVVLIVLAIVVGIVAGVIALLVAVIKSIAKAVGCRSTITTTARALTGDATNEQEFRRLVTREWPDG